jgi:hypothetical protein
MDTVRDRIREHSPSEANQTIAEQTAELVRAHGSHPAALEHRLEELSREWDMERALFAMTSINMLLGLSASARKRRWLVWPAIVAAFQLQHAIQGWCPPVSILRRFHIRTQQEIDSERVALKALRGDFDRVGETRLGADQALAAARR